jgi:hypothetical protein
MKKNPKKDRFALFFFIASAAFLIFGYGVAVGNYKIFPYRIAWLAKKGFVEIQKQLLLNGYLGQISEKSLPWYYRRVAKPYLSPIRNTSQAFQGLNLVTKVAAGQEISAEIIDMDGRQLHTWNIDWFRIWPNPDHIPKEKVPKSKPGTHIHGVSVLENGDLVFNFERLGLVRLDRDSNVVWRLPYQTHHSLYVHDDGNLWVCGQKRHTEPDARFPHRLPPFDEFTFLEVTPEGRIAEEWSVADILHENGLDGLLYLGSLDNDSTQVRGDLLHLNDVEPFPDSMEEDFFERGDILVSLRNINTVFVFNRRSRKIKFICTGWFVRQHDPDFIDGNRFSVFDNNNIAPEDYGHQSRIIIVSARTGASQTYFEGSRSSPFYTDIMGKHQWLPNGNLLITESRQGRAFEINRRGKVVWEYVNYVDQGIVGLVDEVQRLPSDYARFFRNE